MKSLLKRIFGGTEQAQPAPVPDSSGLGPVDVTLPQTGAGERAGHNPPRQTHPGQRKSERLERRELLYAIVRDCMTDTGILSSSYKFKVLSLDSRGTQYLIMVDVPHEHLSDATRLLGIEHAIARKAKEQHDMRVVAVYWRVNDLVASTATRNRVRPKTAPEPAEASGVGAPAPRFEPIQESEVLAFRAAMGSPAAPLPPAGARPSDFADTEIEDTPTPLSGSQYGDLN